MVQTRKQSVSSGTPLSPGIDVNPSKRNYEGSSPPSAWVTFFMERVPIVVYLLLAVGPTMSVMISLNPEAELDQKKLLLGSACMFLFLVTIRFMDDVKDYDTDVVAHPERPLPRGLLLVHEVVAAVWVLLATMLALAAYFYQTYGPAPGLFYTFQIFYLYLMYIEFGCGEFLDAHPLLYAATHQIIILPGCVTVTTLMEPDIDLFQAKPYLMGLLALSGFFTYEVSRKLNPNAPRILGTYLIIYGKLVTFVVVCCSVSLGAWVAQEIGWERLLWPMQALMVSSLAVLFAIPGLSKFYKIVEAVSVFHLLSTLWSAVIFKYCF